MLKGFRRVVVGGCLLLAGWAAAALEEPKVSIELIAGVRALAPGESHELLLRQDIAPGWHTYWINPGDSGDPPDLDFALPPGAEAGPLAFPWPQRIPYGPLMNFGYEKEALMPFTLSLADDFAGGEVALQVSGSLLVCADICIPQKVAASLTLPVGDRRPEPSAAPLFKQARARLPVPLGAPAEYRANGDLRALIALPMAEGHRIASLAYFPYARDLVESAAGQPFTFTPQGIRLRLTPGYDFKPGADLSGVLVVAEAVGGGLVSAYEVAMPAAASAGGAGSEQESMTLLLSLAFAFLGGLILNLMPCVFPVLSIKILSLVEGARSGSVQLHGWVYALGVVASFLAIALALMALRLSGESIGWGFQLQSPVVVALLAYLFVLIGLNFLGAFEFGASIMSLGAGGQGERGSLASSFGTGVLATTVAAPCTAPFMGAAIGYALTQPGLMGLAVFASLGAGMAAPYVALCHAPGLVRRLPRPGAWMETIKQFLAFPMFASALWLVWVLGQQAGTDAMTQILGGALLLALAIWLWQRAPASRPGQLAKRGASLCLWGLAFYLAASLVTSAVDVRGASRAPSADSPAQPYSRAALAAAREQGAVLVNFTAAWCITCKVNELNALSSQTFHEALKRHGVTYLKGDWTNEDPEITASLQEYGRSGVPLYLYYGPGSARAEILPQLLTESLVLQTLAGEG